MKKLRILLSNDDGVHARGLKELYNELRKIGTVFVVAPLEEKSTTGHSLTLHKPLRMIQVEKNFYGVSGSPADCVYVGFREVLKSKKPDLVVSGINRGANLGQDVYYSGTVSAAREACILGIPSIAVSLAIDFKNPPPEDKIYYSTGAQLLKKVLPDIMEHDFPEHTLLNLNVPNLPKDRLRGIVTTRQGFRHYSGNILKRTDHRGRPYYWVGGQYRGFRNDADTDCYAVEHGYASITPIRLDTTDMAALKMYSMRWPFLEKQIRPRRKR